MYRLIALLVVAIALLTGCSQRVRILPLPPAERPPVNLPASERQRNWVARNGEGSCAHASFITVLRWHNQYRLAQWWRQNFEGGEDEYHLQQKLQYARIDYRAVNHGEPWFLDWASRTRHGAIIWWKPGHCCTFAGYIRAGDGRVYAAIIDNNFPQRFELTERSQFLRLWKGLGGFALTPLFPPNHPYSARGYEVE